MVPSLRAAPRRVRRRVPDRFAEISADSQSGPKSEGELPRSDAFSVLRHVCESSPAGPLRAVHVEKPSEPVVDLDRERELISASR
jgi:hypothetical protein